MKTFFSIIVFLLIILSVVFIFFGFFFKPEKLIFQSKKNLSSLLESKNNFLNSKNLKENKIIIYAVGDIMLDRGVEYMVHKYGQGDYRFPFLRIIEQLKEADILFANLESQISDKGRKIGSINSFRAEPEAIEGLKFAGFDVLSVANNHSLDYGWEALSDSLKRIKSAGIKSLGAGSNEDEAFSLKIIEKNDTKIGFLTYCLIGSEKWRATKQTPGIAFITKNDISEIKKNIQEAKKKVDILIISSHLGIEYQKEPSDFQKYLYRSFIEAGADLVLGHHPHVIQSSVRYPPGWIVYSLGNFIFDQGFSEETKKGTLLKIIIKNKKIEKIEEKIIKMNDYFQPALYSEN